jgi:hypothetical protein
MVTHESGGHNHPPTGFIRKYIFSLDHKIICIEYYFLALSLLGLFGDGSVIVDAHPLGVAER